MYQGPLFIASDHAGYGLKKRLIRYLENELKLKVKDLGPKDYNPEDDYPDYILPAAQKAVDTGGRMIVIGGSGNGEAMAANKVKGIRCVLAHSVETAKLGRAHNNANCIAFGARIITEEHAMAMLKTWLETEFIGGKYERRLEEIEEFEEEQK